jgi:AcrR family transcriptional regulator
MRVRKRPDIRRAEILSAAIRLCARDIFSTLTRDELAKRIGVAPGLVGYYWSTMDKLRDDVIIEGCRLGISRIILAGLSLNHPVAKALPDDVKSRAANEV